MGADNLQFAKPINARWQVMSRGQGKHVVFRPDGSEEGIYASRSQAAAIVGIRNKGADIAARRMTRACLCCKAPFESEGIHNRMCPRCRGLGEGAVPYGIAPRSGRPR